MPGRQLNSPISRALTVLALAVSFGVCCNSPDVTKVIGNGDSSCPGGYICAIPAGTTQGAWVKLAK